MRKTKADKSELQKLYDKHKNDKQGSYTDASWKQFQSAMEAAKAVLDNEDASQADVDKAVDSLEKAVKNLKKKATGTSTPKKNTGSSGTKTAKGARQEMKHLLHCSWVFWYYQEEQQQLLERNVNTGNKRSMGAVLAAPIFRSDGCGKNIL